MENMQGDLEGTFTMADLTVSFYEDEHRNIHWNAKDDFSEEEIFGFLNVDYAPIFFKALYVALSGNDEMPEDEYNEMLHIIFSEEQAESVCRWIP